MNQTIEKMDRILKDVEWCKQQTDPIQMAKNMIVSHAMDSVTDQEKSGDIWTEFHNDKMIHWAKVLRILKQNES